MPSGKHDASARLPVPGPVRAAEAATRRSDRPDEAVSLEMRDDVAWEQDGTATDMLSAKHHREPRLPGSPGVATGCSGVPT
jgi:hypothetical protein